MTPLERARIVHERSIWRDVPLNEGKIARLYEIAQRGEHGLDFVAAPGGGLVMATAPLHMSEDVYVSLELVWGAASGGRETIERALQKAKERGASYFMAAAERPGMERLYRAWGGEKVSTSYRWHVNGH